MPGNTGPIWVVIGVSAAIVTSLALVVFLATLDQKNEEPTKVHPPGGMEIVNTYKINNRYFF